MNFIIYDLEASCWAGRPRNMTQEIIEIGAVKMNAYGEIIEEFERTIKPIIHPFLSAYCRELTHIEQSVIDRSSGFVSVVEDFQDWINIFEDDYLLCSWGDFDRHQLIMDCQLHDMESDWVENHYINLKKQFHQYKGWRRAKSLKHVIEIEELEFLGEQHRALSDARNLAQIFELYIDQWQY